MLPLLRSLELLSSCRDRQRLPRILVQVVSEVLGEGALVGLFSRESNAAWRVKKLSRLDRARFDESYWGDLIRRLELEGNAVSVTIDGRLCAASTLRVSELTGEHFILGYECTAAQEQATKKQVACLVQIYANQTALLDYGELDTLTRLLNRKTFDETFDRLVTASGGDFRAGHSGEEDGDERRDHREKGAPAWLCVIDIDHFKRVNDSFGHLFGDEVLLRMGELMRKTFRGGDRLFRFGGEEFVVILNAEDEALAAKSFDRFRQSVENHEFPQVGTVTCSIGFTGVSAMDVPTDVLGRADEALYYAKEHGRNRVCCHERLVAVGAIAKPVLADSTVSDDFDIDALFG